MVLQVEYAREMALDFEQCLRMEVAVNDALSRQPDFRCVASTTLLLLLLLHLLPDCTATITPV
jgi:hypothetical protein